MPFKYPFFCWQFKLRILLPLFIIIIDTNSLFYPASFMANHTLFMPHRCISSFFDAMPSRKIITVSMVITTSPYSVPLNEVTVLSVLGTDYCSAFINFWRGYQIGFCRILYKWWGGFRGDRTFLSLQLNEACLWTSCICLFSIFMNKMGILLQVKNTHCFTTVGWFDRLLSNIQFFWWFFFWGWIL